MNHSTAITNAMNPLAQLRLAWRKPLAALLGASAGLVPVGVFELGHYELTSWSPLECPKAVIVYAGLVFSALTVLGWSSDMFGNRAKALGFTALLEGIMMSAHDGRLSAVALGYLIVINAVANGCRLAMRDHAAPNIDWSSNLARCLSAAGAATAARAARSSRLPRRRPKRARVAKPHLAAIPA